MKQHKTYMKVRDYECDSQGIVNNANYLHYFELARHEMLESCGIILNDLTPKNILPVVRNINVAYKKSLKGCDHFVVVTEVRREGVKFIFTQSIFLQPDNILSAKGEVEIVCLEKGKLMEPILFCEAFKDYLVESTVEK